MTQFENVTTNAAVLIYKSSSDIFRSLLHEVKELSKKKPEATMNTGKVKIINRVLEDLLIILRDEPAGKYLEALDDQLLPQMSDAVLVMVQFDTALDDFKKRYHKKVGGVYGDHHWITKELLEEWADTDEDDDYDEDEYENDADADDENGAR